MNSRTYNISNFNQVRVGLSQRPHTIRSQNIQNQRIQKCMATNEGRRVLFLCLGNICRSPTAEAVFTKVVKDQGKTSDYTIDSCGTGGGNPDWYMDGSFSYHEGNPADPRMTEHAKDRGVILTSKSRPLRPSDFVDFDYIVTMDNSNVQSVKEAARHWAQNGKNVANDWEQRITEMKDFFGDGEYSKYNEVPDPYFGGAAGFELVLDMLQDSCGRLYDQIEKKAGK